MENIGTYILDFIIALVMGVFIKYAVPFIKSKITTENLSFIKTWVEKLVAAAEQTITGSGMGAEKKAWVISMLDKLDIVVDDTVDALIESAVLALNSTVTVVSEAVVTGVEKATGVTEEDAQSAVSVVADNE